MLLAPNVLNHLNMFVVVGLSFYVTKPWQFLCKICVVELNKFSSEAESFLAFTDWGIKNYALLSTWQHKTSAGTEQLNGIESGFI